MHMIFFFLELMKIFQRNSDEYLSGRRNFLEIFSFNRANIPPNILRKLKLKIPRKFRRICIPRDIPTTTSSEYSEGHRSSEYPDGYTSSEYSEDLSDELVVLGVSSEIHFLGIPSEISGRFPRKNEFPRSYFRGHVSSVCRRNNVIPTTYRRFFPS
ncbi:hypothetical protein IGI04_036495, partial [Brassica rapa subsp. trilocularis]